MAVSYPIPEGIVGSDNRLVTVVDGSPITLYTAGAGTLQVYRVSTEIDAHAYTSGTATLTVTWTENAVSQTAIVTAGAVNVVTGIVRLAMPDAGTNITVQLTGPFVATVRIATIIERLAG
jgi:hypothetical protein